MAFPSLPVEVGGILLESAEVPQTISGGGAQAGNMHKLVGGIRIFDAMGPDHADISFNGIFQGDLAQIKVFALNEMRILGNPVLFTYGDFIYYAIIRNFSFESLPATKTKYSITLEIIEDLLHPSGNPFGQGFDEAIQAALAAANAIAAEFSDPGLTASMGGLNSAVGQVGDFTKASQMQINSVNLAVTNAIASVNGLL